MDKWDRKADFNCDSCRYYVPKPNYVTNLGACRKNAPTMTGYPVVNAELDWCGEHKIGSNPVRDKKEEKPYICDNCEREWRAYLGQVCPQCNGGKIVPQKEKSLAEAKTIAELFEVHGEVI